MVADYEQRHWQGASVWKAHRPRHQGVLVIWIDFVFPSVAFSLDSEFVVQCSKVKYSMPIDETHFCSCVEQQALPDVKNVTLRKLLRNAAMHENLLTSKKWENDFKRMLPANVDYHNMNKMMANPKVWAAFNELAPFLFAYANCAKK